MSFAAEDLKKIFGPTKGVMIMDEGSRVYLKTECDNSAIWLITTVTMVLSFIAVLMTMVIIWKLR